MAKDDMTKPRGGSYLKMCWHSREDNMSSGPWTMVEASTYGTGAAPQVGYMNGNDGAKPLCHVGII